MKLIDSISKSQVIVSTGTGGVGKTTTSCALAISLAHEKNAKVLVITIDPAKRLGSVLSEKSLSHDPVPIDLKTFFPEDDIQGELFGVAIDMSKGWNDLVERFASNKDDVEKIYQNSMYQNLTSRFTHSHDFIAMDQLYEYYFSGEYDFIVLDTPPMGQALDFFDAPEIIIDFFGGKILNLVTSPYRLSHSSRGARVFDLASKPFFALANKVLGENFVNDIGEFFYLFKKIQDPLVKRAKDIETFLRSNSLTCAYIMNPSQYLARDFEKVNIQLSERSMDLSTLIVNMLPFSNIDVDLVKDFLKSGESTLLTESYKDFLESEIELVHQIRLNTGQVDGFFNTETASNDDHIETYLIPKSYEIDLKKRLTFLSKVVLESISVTN